MQKILIITSLSLFALSLILSPKHDSALSAVSIETANAAEVEPAATSTPTTEQIEPALTEPAPGKPKTSTAPASLKPAQTTPVSVPQPQTPIVPAKLSIPAAGISVPVVPVGTTASGDMDVPDGSTNDVGWYQFGTKPGDTGSAVIGAHVFAAFKNLNKTKVGSDIYVSDAGGKRLHFRVTKTQVYALKDLTPDMLFTQSDGKHLNLITCAGQPTADGSTYTHRLVVYTALVE